MSKSAAEMNNLGRSAARQYITAASITTVSAVLLLLNIIYYTEGSPSLQQKALGVSIVLLSIYTQISLRANHVYYRKMSQNGCAPAPTYPNNPLGIPFLLESARKLKENSFLQLRATQFDTFGRTYQVRLFPDSFTSIVSDDPENIKAVLNTKFDDWIIPEQRIRAFRPILGSHGIFTTNGPEWQHSRAMLRPAFVRDQISDLACIDKHINKLINRIPTDGSRFDLQALFAMLTIDTISDFMFGQPTDILGSAPEREVKFGAWFDASLVKIAMRSRLGWITQLFPDRELDEYSRFIRSYVDDFLKKKKYDDARSNETKENRKYVFLDELLKSGEPDEVVRNQLLSIFLAGRDTTTSALTYLFYELSRRPDVFSKIKAEIEELGVKDPTWEQLKNMKYLNWSIKESLRLNPPVPSNARETIRDTILPTGGGPDGKSPMFVSKGSIVRYSVWTMHRRKDIYGEDADQFRPERWESLKLRYVAHHVATASIWR